MFEISGMSGDEIVYINGKFCKAKEAAISPFDRGFVLGDGIYEVAPVVNSKICDRADFWERFERSTSQIKLKIPYSREKYEEILYELIARNGVSEGAFYTQITRGAATLMVLPIVKADGRQVGGGVVGKYVPRLREMYAARLRAEAGL